MSNTPRVNRDDAFEKPTPAKVHRQPPPGATNKGGKIDTTGRSPNDGTPAKAKSPGRRFR
jgi:hypothetical protein